MNYVFHNKPSFRRPFHGPGREAGIQSFQGSLDAGSPFHGPGKGVRHDGLTDFMDRLYIVSVYKSPPQLESSFRRPFHGPGREAGTQFYQELLDTGSGPGRENAVYGQTLYISPVGNPARR